jgi:hypothetical protein
MIYLLTDNVTKKKTCIVKRISDLPFDHNQNLHNNFDYMIDNKLYATVSLIPNDLEGTEEQVQNIIHYFFQNYVVKKFDSKDFFSAYLIYTMSN